VTAQIRCVNAALRLPGTATQRLSFTPQLSVEELDTLERERSAQRMELYLEHERFQTEQRQRHLARQSRKASRPKYTFTFSTPFYFFYVSAHRQHICDMCTKSKYAKCLGFGDITQYQWLA